MTRLPDHFSRRLDGRAGDMAQLPEPECSQAMPAILRWSAVCAGVWVVGYLAGKLAGWW